MKIQFFVILLFSMLLLSACGQSGKLYLPKNNASANNLNYTPIKQE